MKDKKKENTTSPSPETESKKLNYCQVHRKKTSKGTCSICESEFCEECLKEYDNIQFCSEHFKTAINNKWVKITDIKTTPKNPEESMYVYEFKKSQWTENKIPSFVVTHYKINLDNDYIESYVQLHVRSDDEEVMKNKINKIN